MATMTETERFETLLTLEAALITARALHAAGIDADTRARGAADVAKVIREFDEAWAALSNSAIDRFFTYRAAAMA